MLLRRRRGRRGRLGDRGWELRSGSTVGGDEDGREGGRRKGGEVDGELVLLPSETFFRHFLGAGADT